jgi:hypothetical protein
MMIFIDTEFNGWKGGLISLALVATDGSEFYEVLEWDKSVPYDPWVAEHVIPFLNKEPIDFGIFQDKLQKFLCGFETISVVADWPDDIKYFCDVLITGPGTRMKCPPLSMKILDIDGDSKVPHNALEDARGIMKVYSDTYYNIEKWNDMTDDTLVTEPNQNDMIGEVCKQILIDTLFTTKVDVDPFTFCPVITVTASLTYELLLGMGDGETEDDVALVIGQAFMRSMRDRNKPAL